MASILAAGFAQKDRNVGLHAQVGRSCTRCIVDGRAVEFARGGKNFTPGRGFLFSPALKAKEAVPFARIALNRIADFWSPHPGLGHFMDWGTQQRDAVTMVMNRR
jgi:hypothetical protein